MKGATLAALTTTAGTTLEAETNVQELADENHSANPLQVLELGMGLREKPQLVPAVLA